MISGSLYCYDNFCPGDREEDWVYEYTDDDGKQFIMIDDKPIPLEEWKKHIYISEGK